MAYEKVKKGKKNVNQEPGVTVGKSGNLYINLWTMENYFKDVKYVVFFIDPKNKKLAIQPTSEKDPDKFNIDFTTASRSTGFISARSSLSKLNLYPMKEKREAKKVVWNGSMRALEATF